MRPPPLFQNHRGFSSFFRQIDLHELYITLGSGLEAIACGVFNRPGKILFELNVRPHFVGVSKSPKVFHIKRKVCDRLSELNQLLIEGCCVTNLVEDVGVFSSQISDNEICT